MKIFENNKSGKLYMLVYDDAENVTNGKNEFMMIYRELYGNNKLFCRNREEFYKKFTRYRGELWKIDIKAVKR